MTDIIELNPLNQEQHAILMALINQESDNSTKLIHLYKGSCYDIDVNGQKIRYQLTHSIKSFFYDNPKLSNKIEIRFYIYNPADVLGRGTYAKIIDNVRVAKLKNCFHVHKSIWAIKEFSQKYMAHDSIEHEREIARNSALKTKYPVVLTRVGGSSSKTFLMRRLGELNLRKLLTKRFLSKHDRLSICLTLCDMIHTQLWRNQTTPPEDVIVHRDIKPDNIAISFEAGQWRAYLIDFGLAMVNGDPIRKLQAAGTPLYAHPSRLDETRTISLPVDDVFSLFITMLDVLTDTKGRYNLNHLNNLSTHNRHLREGRVYPILYVLYDMEIPIFENLKYYFMGDINDINHAAPALNRFRTFLKDSLANQKTPSSHPQEFLTYPLSPELYASHPSVLAALHQHGLVINFQDLLNVCTQKLWPQTFEFMIKNMITPSLDDLDKLFTLEISKIQLISILKLFYQYHPSLFDGLNNHRSDSKLHYTHWLLSNRNEATLESLATYLDNQTQFDAQKELAVNEAKKYLNDKNTELFKDFLAKMHPKFTASMFTIHINHPLILTCFRLYEYLPDNPDSTSFLNYVKEPMNEKTYFDNAKLLDIGKSMLNQFTEMMITGYCEAFQSNPVASNKKAHLYLIHSFRNHDCSTIPVQLSSIRDILHLIPAITEQYQLLDITDYYLPEAIKTLNKISPIVNGLELKTIRDSLQIYHELMSNILFLTQDLHVESCEAIASIIDRAIDLKEFLNNQSNNITNKETVLKLKTLSHMLKRLALLPIDPENQQAILDFVKSMHIDHAKYYESFVTMSDDELLSKIKAGMHFVAASEPLHVVYTNQRSPTTFFSLRNNRHHISNRPTMCGGGR